MRRRPQPVQLKANGADILHDPQVIPFGRNMTVRNPDGLVVEYFEPKQG
jgi:hypothetical protein